MKKSGTIVQYTSEKLEDLIARGEDQTDWARVDALTDQNVEDAVHFAEEGVPDWSTAQVGIPGPKQQLTIRLDLEVIDWFKRQGPRYQTRMNEVLKRYVEAHTKQQPSSPLPPSNTPPDALHSPFWGSNWLTPAQCQPRGLAARCGL